MQLQKVVINVQKNLHHLVLVLGTMLGLTEKIWQWGHLKVTNSSAMSYWKLIPKELESKYGVRYSILLEARLLDPVRFTIIDPMHNLLLGTGRHAFTTWLDNGLLSLSDLHKIQEKSEQISFPYGAGKIPLKIGCSFTGISGIFG